MLGIISWHSRPHWIVVRDYNGRIVNLVTVKGLVALYGKEHAKEAVLVCERRLCPYVPTWQDLTSMI